MSGTHLFGDFELDVEAYALSRAGERVRLERIPMELLILLVRKAGTLVDRKAIQSALWGSNVFVEHDTAINTAIRKIRHALGDDADKPRFVETVVGKGYKFVAPVTSGQRPPSMSSYELVRGSQHYALEGGENVLGRDPSARVCIEHPSVSRRHARIAIGGDCATIEDLASRNGTFVGGERVSERTEIRDGAIIGLGPITLSFLALVRGASTRPMNGITRRRLTRRKP
jgi:DNA-binding winged helix-turn-helix (wHTH) protein